MFVPLQVFACAPKLIGTLRAAILQNLSYRAQRMPPLNKKSATNILPLLNLLCKRTGAQYRGAQLISAPLASETGAFFAALTTRQCNDEGRPQKAHGNQGLQVAPEALRGLQVEIVEEPAISAYRKRSSQIPVNPSMVVRGRFSRVIAVGT